MKKLLTILLALASCLGASAQKSDVFNFGIGLNLGTNGVGLDASIGLTRFIQLRGGVSYVPKMKLNADANVYNEVYHVAGLDLPGVPKEVPVKIQPNMTTYHALLDFYPAGSFHFTVGAYFGQERVVELYSNDGSLKPAAAANTLIQGYNALHSQDLDPIGVHIADNIFTPGSDGNLDAEMKVTKIRPYVGIGFGRAVPRHHRVGCSLDLGVQYWGKPEFLDHGMTPYTVESNNNTEEMYSSISKLPVYPVVTFRICGRII